MTARELEKAKALALTLPRPFSPSEKQPKKRPPRTLPHGVYFSGSLQNPYRVSVKIGGKLINGGAFSTVEEAASMAKKMKLA